ncbi:MAG TPA: hypothetical protein VFN30_01715, partial [Chitinophagaceae bacterium]|nr:hypothetical protein [Chitinophagaceae bacterium]
MKTKISLFLIISFFTAKAQNTVIKAGHLFDARNGKMLDNQIIIIQGGKIKEVGPGLKINKADTVIDLSHSWVLPGLIDCHVHITADVAYRNINLEKTYVTE